MGRVEPWRDRPVVAITIYNGPSSTDFVRVQDDQRRTTWKEAEPSLRGRPTRARKDAPLMSAVDFLEALRGLLGVDA